MDRQFAVDFAALKGRIELLQERRAEAAKRRARKFENAFAGLRHEIAPLQARLAKAAKRLAPRFDILSVLEIYGRERTHSKILANFLNPSGSHAQENLFLSKFI